MFSEVVEPNKKLASHVYCGNLKKKKSHRNQLPTQEKTIELDEKNHGIMQQNHNLLAYCYISSLTVPSILGFFSS